MTTETTVPPHNPCPQWCEVWDGDIGAGVLADPPGGTPIRDEVIATINANKGAVPNTTLDAMLGATDPTPVIVGALVALLVVLAAATVLVRRHRAAATEGDVPHVSVTGGDVS
ncbi:hypothetical protein [Mycolicibacterium fallax]|uniref:Uncharacterized protein n=1 Tax=Mycolicibacterium fallax TaxID=1793 RepID=A0A1X1R7T7_MYCFA|nr:hypothetical protein [Mycolicibacterium fallax]ORV00972.1 hypothetical protein AWC04_14970 [Mycolicibacterium fallax]BBZ00527.1 hypothetical protein MFAL_39930 [Mycolicibacterium fallax]